MGQGIPRGTTGCGCRAGSVRIPIMSAAHSGRQRPPVPVFPRWYPQLLSQGLRASRPVWSRLAPECQADMAGIRLLGARSPPFGIAVAGGAVRSPLRRARSPALCHCPRILTVAFQGSDPVGPRSIIVSKLDPLVLSGCGLVVSPSTLGQPLSRTSTQDSLRRGCLGLRRTPCAFASASCPPTSALPTIGAVPTAPQANAVLGPAFRTLLFGTSDFLESRSERAGEAIKGRWHEG